MEWSIITYYNMLIYNYNFFVHVLHLFMMEACNTTHCFYKVVLEYVRLEERTCL